MRNRLQYYLSDYWEEVGDPRIKSFPLMSGGPLPIFAIIVPYAILVTWIGPALMKNRQPFSLRRIIFVYNLFNIISSVYFFFMTIHLLQYGRLLLDFRRETTEISPRTELICHFGWWYLMSKLFDLVETVFFVMRHKQSQVTFLHVYHHAAVPLIVWIAIKISPTSGPSGLFPLLNAAVHTIMYTYYLLSALGPQYQRYLWWKKYITVMQLAQFVIFMAYGLIFLFLQEGFPLIIILMPNIQSPLFFGLFYNFFKQSYIKKQHKIKSS